MTDPKTKADKDAGNLSESCKTHLIDVYISNKYGRNTDIQNKYVQKGLMAEEDSITLYSRVKKTYFKKNEEHLSNEWIKGTPDIYKGTEIRKADKIIDTKTSWDIFTFLRNKAKPLDKGYYWQGQGYMDLTGAKEMEVAFCLVNTPEILLNDEKRKLMWKMGVATDQNDLYLEACEELERLALYDDIPMSERLISFEFTRNDEDIEMMHRRVERARIFLSEFDFEHTGTKTNKTTQAIEPLSIPLIKLK
jgi:hypothetical protein